MSNSIRISEKITVFVPPADEMTEYVLARMPRQMLQGLVDRGVQLSVPLDQLTDEDCANTVRFICRELRLRENGPPV